MEERSESGAPKFEVKGFAGTLSDWVEGHEELLRGLAAFRDLGTESDDAVRCALTVPELRRMRIGWELWEALAEGDGLDPEILLIEHLPLDLLEIARRALWGEIWPQSVDS